MRIHRSTVYSAIERERRYQQLRWGKPAEDGLGNIVMSDDDKCLEAYILYMEQFLLRARARITQSTNARESLDEIRKVIALGVCAMEQHGCPSRQDNEVKHARTQTVRPLHSDNIVFQPA